MIHGIHGDPIMIVKYMGHSINNDKSCIKHTNDVIAN